MLSRPVCAPDRPPPARAAKACHAATLFPSGCLDSVVPHPAALFCGLLLRRGVVQRLPCLVGIALLASASAPRLAAQGIDRRGGQGADEKADRVADVRVPPQGE